MADEVKLSRNMYVGRDAAALILKNFPKRKFGKISHSHSYAEGINGTSNYEYFLCGDGTGYDSVKEVREYYKAERKNGRFKSKTTQKDRGYGALGEFYGSLIVLDGEQLAQRIITPGHRFYPTPTFLIDEK